MAPPTHRGQSLSVKTKPKILGQLLVDAGAVTADLLEKALAEQPGTGLRIGALMVKRGWAD